MLLRQHYMFILCKYNYIDKTGNLLLFPWHRFPLEMIHVSSKTAAALSSDYDCYGDSYYEDTNEENLERVFQKIENSVGTTLLHFPPASFTLLTL